MGMAHLFKSLDFCVEILLDFALQLASIDCLDGDEKTGALRDETVSACVTRSKQRRQLSIRRPCRPPGGDPEKLHRL